MPRLLFTDRCAAPFGPGVLAGDLAGGSWENVGGFWDGIFPAVDDDWFDRSAFHLLYRSHGGTGLGLTLESIERMDVARIQAWGEWLNDQRERDAEAIRNANK